MANRKLFFLFILVFFCGLLGMDSPHEANALFEGELVDAAHQGDLIKVTNILSGEAGSDYMKQEGDLAFLSAIITKNKKMIFLLLAFGDEKTLLEAEAECEGKDCTVLSLVQETKNPEIIELITTLLRKKTETKFPKAFFSPNISHHLKNLIQQEQKGIYGALFRLTLYDVAKVIVERKKNINGFTVALCIDSDFQQDFCEALELLAKNGAVIKKSKPRYEDSNGYETMHHKFIIFKNINGKQLLWTGSFNLTGTANKNNWENVVVLDDQETIKKFLKEFKLLWKNGTKIPTEDFVCKNSKSDFARSMNNIPPKSRTRFLKSNTAKE